MLLINFFKKASVIPSVKRRMYLMLFLFNTNSHVLSLFFIFIIGSSNAQVNNINNQLLNTSVTHLQNSQINKDFQFVDTHRQVFINRTQEAKQELIIQKQNYSIYRFVFFVLIAVLVIYTFFRHYKYKILQIEKEKELQDALIKVKLQHKINLERLRIFNELCETIERRLNAISSSIEGLKLGFDIKDEKLITKLSSISVFVTHANTMLRKQSELLVQENIVLK